MIVHYGIAFLKPESLVSVHVDPDPPQPWKGLRFVRAALWFVGGIVAASAVPLLGGPPEVAGTIVVPFSMIAAAEAM